MAKKTEEPKTFDLSGEEAYKLVVAALDVVGSVSPGVHKRIRRAYKDGHGTSSPIVSPRRLVELVDVLNEIRPGLANEMINRD